MGVAAGEWPASCPCQAVYQTPLCQAGQRLPGHREPAGRWHLGRRAAGPHLEGGRPADRAVSPARSAKRPTGPSSRATSSRRAGELVDWVAKDEARQRMVIVGANVPARQGSPAALSAAAAAIAERLAGRDRPADRPQAPDSPAIRRPRISAVGRAKVWSRRPFADGSGPARPTARRQHPVRTSRSSSSRRCRRPGGRSACATEVRSAQRRRLTAHVSAWRS